MSNGPFFAKNCNEQTVNKPSTYWNGLRCSLHSTLCLHFRRRRLSSRSQFPKSFRRPHWVWRSLMGHRLLIQKKNRRVKDLFRIRLIRPQQMQVMKPFCGQIRAQMGASVASGRIYHQGARLFSLSHFGNEFVGRELHTFIHKQYLPYNDILLSLP